LPPVYLSVLCITDRASVQPQRSA